MKITVVVPVFNERETLETLVDGILQHTAPGDCRVLFVDDGSTDGSYEVLRALHERHASVDVIRFRRNFGKSAALAAGFARVNGDIVITMDADLQDDPKELPNFIAKIAEGYDVVCGWKRERRDPWHKTFPSRVYNRLVSWAFGVGLHDVNCGYKAFRTEVVKGIALYGDMYRLLPVLAAQEGYRVSEIPVEHHPRRFGRSKYGIKRFPRGAADVLSAAFLARYRYAPGHFFGGLGFLAVAAALVCALMGAFLRRGAGWLGFAAFLLAGGLLFGLGLIAELLVRQHPAPDPVCHIADELIHAASRPATDGS